MPGCSSVGLGRFSHPARPPAVPRKLSLGPLDEGDWRYITRTMDRECRKLCGRGVQRQGDDLELELSADSTHTASGLVD